ncbi:response regulator transcription factor [Pedobacter sp. BMA]|uniref:response regulator transcription factor n=1 Tax=Pedobacter sp. BMA TaxID=1663685 RepID=UPI0006497D16|nr:response regulator transcription factor [Pedobacter sp. BMA]KLT66710.1 hypothetical protein AB669_05975 [Pedobacter sp. BMA]
MIKTEMKLYVLEDEALILQHMLQMLQKLDSLRIVGHSADIANASKEIPDLKPDIILADIRLASHGLYGNLFFNL